MVLVPRRDGELDLSDADAALLVQMSATAIDRRLAPERAWMMSRARHSGHSVRHLRRRGRMGGGLSGSMGTTVPELRNLGSPMFYLGYGPRCQQRAST